MVRVKKDVLGAIVDFLRQNDSLFQGSNSLLAKRLGLGQSSVCLAVKNLLNRGIIFEDGGLVLDSIYLTSDDWRGVRRQNFSPRVAKPNLKNFLGREELLKELMTALQNLKDAQGEILRLQGAIKEQDKTIKGIKTENDRLIKEVRDRNTELRDKVYEVSQLDLQVRELLKGTQRNAATIRKFDSSGVMVVPGE